MMSLSDESRQFKQNVDYRYNIRGWLESVNDLSAPEAGDLFGMNLHYNNPTANGGTPQYNGNISEIQWKGPDAKTNSYGYNYDPMNRLTEANFYNTTNGNRFNEHIKSPDNKSGYDLNGNILFLQRNGKTGIDGVGVTTYGAMDDLRYEYHGNQLMKVTDDAIDTEGFIDGSNTDNDYDYDKNGNMIIDKNKSIDDATTATGKSVISYNYLNLPEKVVKSNGEYLKYIYDATGRKLSQEVYNASNELQKKSDYAGEFFYEDNTLKFVNHEEGRVVMSGTQGEYQYHLKDHLGNVRLTFTTKEELETVTATLEDAKASTEQSQFLNYAEVRKIDNKVFDHTDEGGTYNSTRLMGGNTTEVYGLAKTLSVMPGDVIRMEVYAKYLDPETDNWSAALQNVISSIAGSGNAGGTYVDGGQLGTIDGAFPYPGLLVRENDEGSGPKAYLNYLVFDRDFNYLTGGFERVSTAARESGTTLNTNNAEGINHEYLHFDDGIVIEEAGYVYIYLSNENETPVEVFFDDFMVEHVKSPVVQMDDYYPFGLTFNHFQRENSIENRYLFNGGSELQADLNLGFYSTLFRAYDPSIGRFIQIDPLTDFFTGITPYSFAFDNPISYTDPDGLAPMWWVKFRANVKQAWYNVTGRGDRHAHVKVRNPRKTGATEVGAKTAGRRPTPSPRTEQVARTYAREESQEQPDPILPQRSEPDPVRQPDPIEPPPTPDPVFRRRSIPENESITFSEQIEFQRNSDRYTNNSSNNKVISDLVKTLKDYPQLTLFIVGNVGTDFPGQVSHYGNTPEALGQTGELNGRPAKFGTVMTSRAKAIYNALIKSGIDASRLDYGPGNVYPTPKGRVTSFILRN